jgi:hypothetical protein
MEAVEASEKVGDKLQKTGRANSLADLLAALLAHHTTRFAGGNLKWKWPKGPGRPSTG